MQQIQEANSLKFKLKVAIKEIDESKVISFRAVSLMGSNIERTGKVKESIFWALLAAIGVELDKSKRS